MEEECRGLHKFADNPTINDYNFVFLIKKKKKSETELTASIVKEDLNTQKVKRNAFYKSDCTKQNADLEGKSSFSNHKHYRNNERNKMMYLLAGWLAESYQLECMHENAAQ